MLTFLKVFDKNVLINIFFCKVEEGERETKDKQ